LHQLWFYSFRVPVRPTPPHNRVEKLHTQNAPSSRRFRGARSNLEFMIAFLPRAQGRRSTLFAHALRR